MELEEDIRLTYGYKQIIRILDSYIDVSNGDFNQDQIHDFTGSNREVYRAPFENSIISKADLDIAIDSIGRPGAWSLWSKDIEQHPRRHNLTPKQYKLAMYIRGNDNNIKGIARGLALIA